MTTTLIILDSPDDDDNADDSEKTSENGTHYIESYLHANEADHDDVMPAHARARSRKKPRFLLRYEDRSNYDRQSLDSLFFTRNLLLPTDSDSQSLPEVVTINNDYCHIDAQTLKRKPIHRAGFFLYKRGSLRSTRQVRWRLLCFELAIDSIFSALASQTLGSRAIQSFCKISSNLVGQESV